MLNNIMMLAQRQIEINIDIIKLICIILYTYYTNFKIMNKKIEINFKSICNMYLIIIIALIGGIIRHKVDFLLSTIFMVFMISIVWNKNNISKSILTTIISLSINYSIFLIAIIINFIINATIILNTDIVNLIIIILLHGIILYSLFRVKKFKCGITFLKNNLQNEYMDILTLNISAIILFAFVLITNSSVMIVGSLSTGIIIISIIMFITIQKSLQLYYKQKLLVKELDETKEELLKKTKEVEELEKENIEISKKSHTLVHKQRALEYKLEKIASKAEISIEEAAEVRDRLKEIKEDLYTEKSTIKLDKTGISKIDDMLEYMQEECKKNKIEFELQIKGNIHYMTNNLITIEDLETLIADHVKNAIIAINHTENTNRSILVRLGEIDGIYSLYIYDSGVEFTRETLENLGKKPSTTHTEEGGTGMGFMNTFDTLRKCEASLIINEFNEPSKDNYTKAIIIKFDKKNEFKIISYRENEVTVK